MAQERSNSGISVHSHYTWVVLGALLAATCSGRSDSTTSSTHRPLQPQPSANPFAAVGRVGNQVQGLAAIPDYDQAAQELRHRIEPQLPPSLPPPRVACTRMLDEAKVFYRSTEAAPSRALDTMNATHSTDLEACVQRTGPAAATCVAILMAANEGEFPWVLDQCSRAFPIASHR